MAGRRSLAVGIALLVLLAGCSAFGTDTPGSGPDAGSTDGGVDSSASPIYEPPLNTTDVAVEHVLALRRAESFRYRSTVTIAESNQSAAVQFGRTAAVEMNGEMLVTRNETGMRSQLVYVSGNGTNYVKVMDGGQIGYNVTNTTIDTSRYAINGVPRFLDMFTLTYDGATTMNGKTVYKYSADSPEQVNSLSGIGQSGSKRTLSHIEAELFIAENGLVTQLGYSMGFDTGQGAHNITAVTTYTDLGTTTVSQPDWVADAKAATGADEMVTRTIENETLGAELTLTAASGLFDRIRIIDGPGPLYEGNRTYEQAAASPAVTALIPPSSENASLTLAYETGAIPEGNESELALYQYVATRNTWEQVDATQDRDADTFTTDLSKSAAVVVMHEPSWEATQAEQS